MPFLYLDVQIHIPNKKAFFHPSVVRGMPQSKVPDPVAVAPSQPMQCADLDSTFEGIETDEDLMEELFGEQFETPSRELPSTCPKPDRAVVQAWPRCYSARMRTSLSAAQRLHSFIPPANFGAVHSGSIFRSAFPKDSNLEFLETLCIKTLLVLVDTAPSDGYSAYMSRRGIAVHRIDIAPNKGDGIDTTLNSLCEAILALLDPENQPIHIHCNQGRHRTGCVIACLRKCQGWSLPDVIAEYETYALPKVRRGDLRLIESFNPKVVAEFARAKGVPYPLAAIERIDSVTGTKDLRFRLALPPTSTSSVAPQSSPEELAASFAVTAPSL